MANEMIERVARACANAARMPHGWRGYTHIARAAIEAMREPTEAMVLRGDEEGDVLTYHHVYDEYDSDSGLEHGASRTIWQAMLSAALNEQPRPVDEKEGI